MMTEEEPDTCLSVLDLLDLDESVVDDKIDYLIRKSDLSVRQLQTLHALVGYKRKISLEEETECENEPLINFALKNAITIQNGSDQTFQLYLKILATSMELNQENIAALTEHILQQLLPLLTLDRKALTEEDVTKNIAFLTIINETVHTSYRNRVKLNLKFMKMEIDTLLKCREKKINVHLYSQTIPNLIKCSEDYEILNTIYDRVIAGRSDILILCTLSDFYFPTESTDWRTKLKSSIVEHVEFWKFIQKGFLSNDEIVKKCSSYLAKRAIDYVLCNEINIQVYNQNDKTAYFSFEKRDKNHFKNVWHQFFVISESIEEKQFHLVKPALELIPNIEGLHPTWTYCLLKHALEHDNNLVVVKALNLVLKMKPIPEYFHIFPFEQLLSALNKMFIYDEFLNTSKNKLMPQFHEFISDHQTFSHMIRAVTRETFSPIPRFFLTYMLLNESTNRYTEKDHQDIMRAILSDAISYTTNNRYIETGTQICLLNFLTKNLNSYISIELLVQILTKFSHDALSRNNKGWKDLIAILGKYSNEPETCHKIRTTLYDANFEQKMPATTFARFILILRDASVLDEHDFMCLLDSKIETMNELGKRPYAAVDELDSIFHFIVACFDSIISDQKNDLVYEAFIHFMTAKCDVLSQCFIKRLHDNSYEIADLYAKGLESILKHKIINLILFNKINSAMINSIAASNEYFAVRILSKMAHFVQNCDSFQDSEKLNHLKCYINMLPHISLSSLMDHKKISLYKGAASLYYDSVCEINYYFFINVDWTNVDVPSVNSNVLELLEKGGCLLWTTTVCGSVLPHLIADDMWEEAVFLLNRIWKEIMQVRKNEQFKKCLKKFIEILFNREIFKFPQVQNLCLDYGMKIFEIGELNSQAIYLLVNQLYLNLKESNLLPLGQLLVDAMLYGAVLRKDQRIELDVYEYLSNNIIPYSESFDYLVNPTNAIKTILSKIILAQTHNVHSFLMASLKDRINILCKSKHHYHTNSLNHRILLRALQNIVFLLKISILEQDDVSNITWSVHMLSKHPHHISIKILYEWIIALYLLKVNEPLVKMVNQLNLSQLPQISFFTIIYQVVRHQLLFSQKYSSTVWENFDFAMNALLPFTMGQLFNVRLHAQYLSSKLFESCIVDEKKAKFSHIHDIIVKNLSTYADEKHLKNIQLDFYINCFDIMGNLNAETIFHHLPRLIGISKDEWISKNNTQLLDEHFESNETPYDISVLKDSVNSNTDWEMAIGDETPQNAAIQKKFIPWKSMLLDMGIMNKDHSENETSKRLIVVASLIDRLPNLGGLSRTCEVFGVKQYVINSLRHLQDKQFQSLSVSSENWIDIVQVQPGAELKRYLMTMKERGYKVIGVEQTTSSVPLNKFTFPKDTVLLLGHEKDGIPADLLYMADHCVEVPQRGLVRSLNVHVTASIFIWEYSMQHVFGVLR